MSDRRLEANLVKYQLFVVFQKRAFLPAIGIYLVSVGKLSLLDISTIASITVAVRLLLEIPTGRFADRFGRKQSTMVGSLVAALSPLAYIAAPGYIGGLAGSLLYFGGWAFVSGAHNAFLHDTMQALGREAEYARFRGRAQSYSLLGNTAIVALVPMTYGIDPRLPFLLGFGFLLLAFLLACSYSDVRQPGAAHPPPSSVRGVAGAIARLDLLILFSVYGIVAATLDNAQQFREILLSGLGVPYFYLGLILAASSLLAAAMGRVIHRLAALPQSTFYFVDILAMAAFLALVGLTRNMGAAIAGYMLLSMYDRNRAIVAEAYLLTAHRASGDKATLLSILGFFPSIHGVWVSLALGASLRAWGISTGMAGFGALAGGALLAAMLAYAFLHRRRAAAAG